MLKLFQSIFSGGRETGRYPETLIEAAIERAVDATDPRLRAISGYRKRLRDPVLNAMDHAVALVDNLPEALPADNSTYASDARLSALFASPERMRDMFGSDSALGGFRDRQGDDGARITALLLAERVEKNVMGVELSGEMLRRDVPQVAVSFRGHRLVDPAGSEVETRRQLKRRAFDHLLSLALLRMTEVREERADLNRQRDLLRRKLRALAHGGWEFEAPGDSDPSALQAELDAIEMQLLELGTDDRALVPRLDIAARMLADPGQQFWADTVHLNLDRMNIRRGERDASARAVDLHELHNARGHRFVILLLAIAPGDLPPRVDFLDAAQRHLV